MSKEKEKEKEKAKQEVQKAEQAKTLSPLEEMDRLFDEYFSRGWLRPFRWEWPARKLEMPFQGKTPNVNVIERDDEIVVKAELPGVDKKDLDISVTSTSVSIKGTTSHEEKEEKGDYYRCEISSGMYSRTLALPAEVDDSKAKASFKDGMLEITLPKLKKEKRRSVKVE